MPFTLVQKFRNVFVVWGNMGWKEAFPAYLLGKRRYMSPILGKVLGRSNLVLE